MIHRSLALRSLSTTATSTSSLLSSITSTRSVLSDSTLLLNLLPSPTDYTKQCPTLKATIGQHFRHLYSHIDTASKPLLSKTKWDTNVVLNYDARERGNPIETEHSVALTSIKALDSALAEVERSATSEIAEYPITVAFNLSSTPSSLPSTFQSSVVRELAFSSHHALHHLAMIKIIAESEAIGIKLPEAFGKAPSTNIFESKVEKAGGGEEGEDDTLEKLGPDWERKKGC